MRGLHNHGKDRQIRFQRYLQRGQSSRIPMTVEHRQTSVVAYIKAKDSVWERNYRESSKEASWVHEVSRLVE